MGDEPDIDFPTIDVQHRSRLSTSACNKENTDNGNAAVYTQLLPPQPDFSEEVALNQQQKFKKTTRCTYFSVLTFFKFRRR